jgi:hypothetical protein
MNVRSGGLLAFTLAPSATACTSQRRGSVTFDYGGAMTAAIVTHDLHRQ